MCPYKATLIIAAIFLSSCSALKDLKQSTPPDVSIETPANWQSEKIISENEIDRDWIKAFNDPKLINIANQIIENNQDLKAAEARVEAASALAGKAGANLLPTVDLGIKNQSNGNFENSKKNTNSTSASFDIAWEVDLWGKIKSSQKAAIADLKAGQSNFEYVKKSLIAAGTKAYFLAIEASKQEEYAQNIYNSHKKTLEISEAFFKEGMVSSSDVHLAKLELANSLNALEKAKEAKLQALRALEILMGKYPKGDFEIAAELPKFPDPISAGIPAEILENRPDLVAANQKVATAFNKLVSAKAARLPRIALTSSVGASSSALSEITNPANAFWNFAGNLLTPIFDGKKAKYDVKIATANQKEAVANYKKVALKAFGEVENSLSKEQSLLKRFAALKEAQARAKSAEEIASHNYENGEGNLLSVLQLKRNSTYANIEMTRVEQELLSERVNLYLALGL